MKPVIHARRQTERDVTTISKTPPRVRCRQADRQARRGTLDLQDLAVPHDARRADDRIAGLTRMSGSISIGRAPSFSSRVKQSCTLRKRVCFASLRSRSAKKPHIRSERSRTTGCSIRLNQPMNRVSIRRGMRFVSRKFRSSRRTIFIIIDRPSWDHRVTTETGRFPRDVHHNLIRDVRRRRTGGLFIKLKARLELSMAKHRRSPDIPAWRGDRVADPIL
jgi:hypothetical protein